ncbi:MAG: hypothetical protein C4293_07710 [Nitrospiraceae bacterium]
MPRKVAWNSIKLPMAAILWGSVLWGCTASLQREVGGGEDASVREAFRQREDAYARLIKAIGSYCSMKHESLEARLGCVLDKQAEVQGIRLGWIELRADLSMFDPTEPEEQTGRRVVCEGITPRITCLRVPSIPELLARRSSRAVPAGFSEHFSQ